MIFYDIVREFGKLMAPITPNSNLHNIRVGRDVGLRILLEVGKGSFACVYLAEDKLGKQFAVKAINKETLSVATLETQREEAHILAKLSHPNIVKLINTIETAEFLYIIEEICDMDLFDQIEAGIPPEIARTLFRQICKAVDYCHQNQVCHRDLKPENILLKEGQIKLADFGLATTDLLSGQIRIGSVRYMSPEMFHEVDSERLRLPYKSSANDIWALGIILFNMLTSHNPWNEPPSTSREIKRNIDLFSERFGFSKQLVSIFRLVFELDQFKRPKAAELFELMHDFKFYADVAIISPGAKTSFLSASLFHIEV
jgi:serine/threonine protein kinase